MKIMQTNNQLFYISLPSLQRKRTFYESDMISLYLNKTLACNVLLNTVKKKNKIINWQPIVVTRSTSGKFQKIRASSFLRKKKMLFTFRIQCNVKCNFIYVARDGLRVGQGPGQLFKIQICKKNLQGIKNFLKKRLSFSPKLPSQILNYNFTV